MLCGDPIRPLPVRARARRDPCHRGLLGRLEGARTSGFSVITVPANPVMSSCHARMPAILHPRDYDEWLDRVEVERARAHPLRPYDGSDLAAISHT
jgi:putative SOS response-associated peptidase YedK